jgi:hypothetical protein
MQSIIQNLSRIKSLTGGTQDTSVATTPEQAHGGPSGHFGTATGTGGAHTSVSISNHSTLMQALDRYAANGMTAAEAAAVIRAAEDEGIINTSQMGQLLARYAKGM